MVASGLVVGFATGGFPAYSKEISQVALVLGMTFSLTEISIAGISPRVELRPFLLAFGMSYVVLSGLILLFAVASPDPVRGAIVKAFVLLARGIVPSTELADEIGRHVRERVAAYARPRKIVFVHELPTTVSGKIRRSELRAPDADERWGALIV